MIRDILLVGLPCLTVTIVAFRLMIHRERVVRMGYNAQSVQREHDREQAYMQHLHEEING